MRPHPGTGLVVVALTATLAALVFPVWSYGDRAGTGAARSAAGAVPTRWGPLSTADRDFVVRVRLAGLWALPAAQQATGRAPSRVTEAAGRHLADDHTYLGVRVRDVAARLRMPLPSQPTEEQRGWLERLTEAHGPAYEPVFAGLLRRAHGGLFSAAAEVRATTRNTLVRALADDTVRLLLGDLTALEAIAAPGHAVSTS
ncbi:DUF4142 domain-containing protein [Streptomyces sp. NPDC016309]|uniref:DUF4142 domain-containing protein n=1 Tax=Streptomyces sp. NPDC016309 TaxID=3364965 RepID=UPI0036FB5C3E